MRSFPARTCSSSRVRSWPAPAGCRWTPASRDSEGFFTGERIFFLRAFTEDEPGEVFYNSYGAIRELELEPGRELVVDTGHLVAFTDGLEYSIGKVGGLRSLVLGGEGLVMRFQAGEGGRIWIQTRNLVSLAEQIVPFMPSRK